jgi:hypothetical protein
LLINVKRKILYHLMDQKEKILIRYDNITTNSDRSLFSKDGTVWETRSITLAITFNKDQIRGVLRGFCRGLPFRYWGNAMEIEVTWKGRKLGQFKYLSRTFTPSENLVLGAKTWRLKLRELSGIFTCGKNFAWGESSIA